MTRGRIETRALNVFAGARPLLRNVSIGVEPRQVFAIIGPSGAGKSTLLRCLNRLIEMDSGLRLEGDVLLDDVSIFDPGIDADALRARVGIIFQQPVVFPVSIYKNTIFGIRRVRRPARSEWPRIAEAALKQAALWDEVKGRLHESALKLSVGQQQRLCLARALAVRPEILLMDEPTSSLDAASTELIESLIRRLKTENTIVLVTHDLGQALRVADQAALLGLRNHAGEIVACGASADVITQIQANETQGAYQ